MIPVYEFTQRDAADRFAPKKFTDLLIGTGRFYRDERSHIKFKVAAVEHDYVVIDSKHTLAQILLSGEVVEMHGSLEQTDFDVMWLWFTSRRWTFPRLNPERPWTPDRPKSQFGAVPAKPVRR